MKEKEGGMLHNQTVMLQNALGFTQLSLMKDFDGQFPQQKPSFHRLGHLHVHADVIHCGLCGLAYAFVFVPADG